MKTLLSPLFALAMSLGLSSHAIAHDDAYLDTLDHPHGGQMRMTGAYHLELVTKDGELALYVSDHADQPITTEGASARATILSGGQRTTVRLSPTGENRMHGTGAFEHDEGMTVVVSITLPGQESQQARFTPYQSLAVTRQDSTHHEHEHGHEHHHH